MKKPSVTTVKYWAKRLDLDVVIDSIDKVVTIKPKTKGEFPVTNSYEEFVTNCKTPKP